MNQKSIKITSPSNIALVKYWGKYGNQYPCNPSISFTLNHCKTEMEVAITPKKADKASIEVYFEGKKHEKFVPKIATFFDKIKEEYAVVSEYDWEIKSTNTFPHSSGIASSASSMSAVAAALVAFQHSDMDLQEISRLARIGSGSACRSVFPKIAWWGKEKMMPLSSHEHAIPCWEEMDEVFLDFKDTILIASSGEKSVSSTAGHGLMNNHFFAERRYAQAHQNALEIYHTMRSGDLERFGEIVEEEALTLHALMMMSSPSFILLKPATLAMIEKIRQFRAESKLPVYFTLDAGPNIHLLYPNNIVKEVENFIEQELKPLCENQFLIKDEVGQGLEIISKSF